MVKLIPSFIFIYNKLINYMAIFKNIGKSFKEGWNKNSNIDKSYNDEYKVGKNTFYYSKHYSDVLDSDNVSSLSKDFNTIGSKDISLEYTTLSYNSAQIENPYKLSSYILNEVTKNYKFIYDATTYVTGNYGISEDGKEVIGEAFQFNSIVPSMFNPLYGINSVSINAITPLVNAQSNVSSLGNTDITDCSIKRLVNLSNEGKLGRGIYKYADFMYCKDLGKYSNNRLITLRKFPTPIGDDIWNIDKTNPDGVNIPGDIGRLITWMGEDNHLEDILQYNYKDSFTESKEGKFYDIDSRSEDSARGFLGKFINLANPKYNAAIGAGKTAGGSIPFVNGSKFPGASTLLSGQYANGTSDGRTIWDRYDDNRVYEPKATMRDTHLYEGKLTFSQDFTLVFNYELRAYENINPKSALLDLLNNIHQVTYRKGTFWGGEVWWKGAPENTQLWKTSEAMIDGAFEKLSNTFTLLCSGELNVADLFGNLFNSVGKLITKGADAMEASLKNPTETATKLLDTAKGLNLGSAFKGIIKNKLGRPSLYAVNSILSGDPTGFWHVTIGNPLNPIMSMGNMIIDDSKVQHYGPLGIDDFPTGVKVTITLKHGRSRDMTEIGKMYTRGNSGIGIPMARNEIENYIKGINSNMNLDMKQFTTMWASTVPSTNYTNDASKKIQLGELKSNPPESQEKKEENSQQSS